MFCLRNFCQLKHLLSLSLAVVMLTTLWSGSGNAEVCWKDSYGRGVGTIPDTCAAGQVKDGLLCYPAPQPGYTVKASVYWQNCPGGYTDIGAFCQKPQPYGRGSGYAIWNETKCKNQHKDTSCEKNGAMWYPKCKPGFHNVGCCICSPDCPAGMADTGTGCTKNTYTKPPISDQCAAGKQSDAGLCYNPCKDKYDGIGPVCWGRCQEGMVDCGAMCGATVAECAESIGEMALSVTELLIKVAELVETFGGSAAVEGAENVALNAVKEIGKTLAKKAVKKYGTAIAKEALVPKVAADLKKSAPNLSDKAAEQLAKVAASGEDEKFDYMEIVKSLDVIGITDVIDAFNKDICNK